MTATAIYCRISRDATAEGLGVERQRQDCLDLAERLGLEVVGEFVDNDVSASTGSRKARPQYAALIEAVRSGRVGSVLTYSNSRLTRRPLELEDWISLHAQTGVVVRTVASGEDDLSTADGRMVARLKASIDAGEAERTSERLARKWRADAEAGKPRPGRHRSFGYSRSFEVVEDEAVVVKEAFARRAAGESFTGIAKDLTARGLVTSAGMSWNAGNLAKMFARPGYCGLREHRGEIVGRTAYPAIVDEPTWRAAQQAKRSPGSNARRWVLSNTARCGRCGEGLTGSAARDGYRCNATSGGCGRIRIKAQWLEEPVTTLVLAREAARTPVSRTEVEPVDLGAIDAEIEAVRAAFEAQAIDLTDMLAATKVLRARRREAEEQSARSVVSGLTNEMTALEWFSADLSARKVTVARHVHRVVVGPRTSTGPGRYEPERITIHWTDGSTEVVTQDALDRCATIRTDLGMVVAPKVTA